MCVFSMLNCVFLCCVVVPPCWLSLLSCWRAPWLCRNRCWGGKDSWWSGTCWRRYIFTSASQEICYFATLLLSFTWPWPCILHICNYIVTLHIHSTISSSSVCISCHFSFLPCILCCTQNWIVLIHPGFYFLSLSSRPGSTSPEQCWNSSCPLLSTWMGWPTERRSSNSCVTTSSSTLPSGYTHPPR